MNTNRVLNALGVLLIASLAFGTAQAQEDSPETLAEQDRARTAEANPSTSSDPRAPALEGVGEPGPLFAGVDDASIDAVRIDVVTNAFTTAFSGVEVWGAAYDADNDRVLFNAGSTLWEWPVGGVPNMLGTIMDGGGAVQAMVGLAWHDGTLYGTKNISNEAIWAIDPATQVATVHIDYVDGDLDCGGVAVDQATGEFYCSNDDSTPHGSGLVRVNPDASVDHIAAYPGAESDVDGLAVGGGRAYLVTDNANGPIYVYDFAGAAYEPELVNPWPTSEIFAAGAWLLAEGGEAEPIARFEVQKDFNDENPAGVDVTISCNTGLPLEQSSTISEGDGVTFVVTDFADGEMDCVISEEVPDGYDVEYFTAGGPSLIDCGFDDVAHGAFLLCEIENVLLDVDVEVTKVWIDENPQFNASNVAEASWSCTNGAFEDTNGTLDFFGNPDTESFSVFPNWDGGTTCSITETSVADGGVEIDDSECQNIVVFPGVDGSCTIYNTRFYQGIPTLSQYGLGLLALLMMGVGLVAFRRFV